MCCASSRALLLGAWLCAGAVPVQAAEAPVSSETLRAVIFLRAMAYERGLGGDPVPLRMAVLDTGPTDDAMAEAFGRLTRTAKVGNRAIELTVVPAARSSEWLSALRALQPHVVYVPAHQGTLVEQVSQAFSEARTLVLCADPADMPKGCLLAVEQEAGKSRVVIHLSAAQRLGLHFDGRLLQLARVVSE